MTGVTTDVRDYATEINGILAASRARQAYWDGLQDGALIVLAGAVGSTGIVKEGDPTFMGHRFRVTVEWIDDEPNPAVAEAMTARAIARRDERLHA